MFENIKEKLKSMLAEMNKATTVDGTEVEYDGDEIEVGTALQVEDGSYEFDDFTITVKDGVVTEKIEKEAEEEEEVEAEEEEETTSTTTEEPKSEEEETTTTTEAPAEDDEVKKLREELDALQAQIDGLKAEIEALKDKIAEIASAPAVDPIEEVFRKSNVEDVKDKKLKNILKYAETLKN